MRKLKVLFVFIGALSISLAPAQTFQKMTIEEMFELADANSRSIRMFRLAEEEAGQAVKVARNAQLPSIDVSVSASYLGMPGWQTVILQMERMPLCRTSAITLQ